MVYIFITMQMYLIFLFLNDDIIFIQVGGYVAEFLKVSIPSIISGVGDSISMVVLEEEVVGTSNNNTNDRGERTGKTTTIERFVFNFQMNGIIGSKEETKSEQNHGTIDIEDLQQCAVARDTELATEAKAQLERTMRECLLRVLTLRKRRRRDGEKAENISFKLCLHVAEEKKQLKENNSNMEADDKGRDTSKCKELNKALQQGEWLIPEESSCLFPSDSSVNNSAQKGRLRPLKDIVVPSCGLGMQIEMEVDP